ncbi:MAG: matrixin family metalloprotease [Gemmataceae bacterium]
MGWFLRRRRANSIGQSGRPAAQLALEHLETRLTPAWSGNAWPHPELVTVSFVPDGTLIGYSGTGPIYSNLFARFNSHTGWTTATWQNKIVEALQTWAQQTNINFDIVPDNGAQIGSGDYQQGDPGFGDIRIGGFNMYATPLAGACLPPPINNFSIAGDFNFNTGYAFNIGTTFDLKTVAMHELGHTLGLSHTTVPLATMFPTYNVIKNALNADDITSIRSGYGGARTADVYDAVASNNTFATATSLTSQIDPDTLTSVQTELDITTTTDADYYTFTAPADTTGTLTVQVQTAGLSLLRQAVTVYAANQTTILKSGSSAGAYDGTTVTLTVSGVTPGQVFYVKVAGADTTAFGTGRYAMTLNFGGGPAPTVPLPNTQTLNGYPIQGGGGGEAINPEWLQESAGYEELEIDPSLLHRPATFAASNGTEKGPDWSALLARLEDGAWSAPRWIDAGATVSAHSTASDLAAVSFQPVETVLAQLNALLGSDGTVQEQMSDALFGTEGWLSSLTDSLAGD